MKKTFKIAVIPGDGTGPEVVAEGLKVLKAVEQKGEGSFTFIPFDLGGERYLKTGDILPDAELSEAEKNGCHLSGGHRPSGGETGYPGKRFAAETTV